MSFPYTLRVAIWIGSTWIAGLILHRCRQLSPGYPRMAIAAIAVALNFILPLLFDPKDDVMTVVVCFMATSGISSFKVLAWALNRGPLADSRLTPGQFAVAYGLTLIPALPGPKKDEDGMPKEPVRAEKSKKSQLATGPPKHLHALSPGYLMRSVVLKHIGVAVIGLMMGQGWVTLPHQLVIILFGLLQYLSMSGFMDASALGAWYMVGLPVAPHFRNPYASTSPSDFWNKRWNLPVSAAMRALIYDPMMEGRWILTDASLPRSKDLRLRAWAVMVVFFVSGIVHEGMYWYVMGHCTPYLMWFQYFVYWGCIVLVDNVLRHSVQQRSLPVAVQRLFTLLIFHFMIMTFWWPPIEASNVPNLALQHVKDFMNGLLAPIDGLVEGCVRMFELQTAES